MKYILVMYGIGLVGSVVAKPDRLAVDGEHFSLRSVQVVQRRYYLIRRLEEPVGTLERIQKQIFKNKRRGHEIVIDPQLCSLFHHPVLKAIAEEMVATRSVEPFYEVWGDFLSYRYIEDKSFVREAVTLLLLLYKKLLLTLLGEHPDATGIFEHADKVVRSQLGETETVLIEQVATAATQSKRMVLRYYPELTSMLVGAHTPAYVCRDIDCDDMHDNLSSLAHLLEDDDIATKNDILIVNNNVRFYHIQRLLRPMFILSRRGYVLHLPHDVTPEAFDHERIKECVRSIQQTNSLVPIFREWKHFVSYVYIDDRLFIQEYIRLIIIIYRTLQIAQLAESDEANKVAVQDLFELYEALAGMPIPEMLDLLDDMVDVFAQAAQEYEFNNQSLTWSEWIREYWWSIPRVIKSMATTVAKHADTLKKVVEQWLKNAVVAREIT